ncbi:hypothetical protein MAR_030035 [Mya arenaria]|uniref:Uncharacterized protein n=1 Tax=Mya arenaria TaxID=6604 RepID=A0ABY7DLW8_MYAAR|nr:hypothetical protein MAR_030035 [Mya arenaria]
MKLCLREYFSEYMDKTKNNQFNNSVIYECISIKARDGPINGLLVPCDLVHLGTLGVHVNVVFLFRSLVVLVIVVQRDDYSTSCRLPEEVTHFVGRCTCRLVESAAHALSDIQTDGQDLSDACPMGGSVARAEVPDVTF